MWNSRLDGAQAGIKTAGENINNLRYADDMTHVAENEEELKSLLMKVKVDTLVLFLILGGMFFSFSSLGIMFAVGLSYMAFTVLR